MKINYNAEVNMKFTIGELVVLWHRMNASQSLFINFLKKHHRVYLGQYKEFSEQFNIDTIWDKIDQYFLYNGMKVMDLKISDDIYNNEEIETERVNNNFLRIKFLSTKKRDLLLPLFIFTKYIFRNMDLYDDSDSPNIKIQNVFNKLSYIDFNEDFIEFCYDFVKYTFSFELMKNIRNKYIELENKKDDEG